MFNITFVLDFLKHRFNAKTRHGVHSPFVYNLVDKVIYDFSPKPDYKNIEDLRNFLSVDDRFVSIKPDEGFNNHDSKMQVSQIVNRQLMPKKLAQLIYRLAQYHKPNTVLELGTSLGITSSYISSALLNATITTVEANKYIAEIANENFVKLNISKNIKLVQSDFNSVMLSVQDSENQLDFIFINESKTKEEMLTYFEFCLPKINNDSLLIYNNIYQNEETKAAWRDIKAHPEVAVTIDLFWIGLVYFKKGIAKEHFKIKF